MCLSGAFFDLKDVELGVLVQSDCENRGAWVNGSDLNLEASPKQTGNLLRLRIKSAHEPFFYKERNGLWQLKLSSAIQ